MTHVFCQPLFKPNKSTSWHTVMRTTTMMTREDQQRTPELNVFRQGTTYASFFSHAFRLLVCISIPSVLVTIGFGIWAVVIWNMNRMNQTDDTSCKSRSILEILLAVGIIDIIQGSLITIGMCFSIMAAYRQNAFTSNLERCFSFIRSMAGLSTFVLAIVLSVFVWGSNCNTVKGGKSFNNSLISRNLHNG